jgi:hypothetical protein
MIYYLDFDLNILLFSLLFYYFYIINENCYHICNIILFYVLNIQYYDIL